LWHGRDDRLVPLSHASALAAAIPSCTAVVDGTENPSGISLPQAGLPRAA
jgi:predicted esterase